MNKLKKCITKQKKKVIGLGITAALLAATLAPALTTEASWIHNNTGWWWSEENGYPANEWRYINGEWYWFDATGYMATGWRNVGGTWYYMDASGAMATGWRNVGGTWYYMDASGAMATGWRNVGGTWYYMDASGAMQTGWQNIGETWYYMYDDGAMASNTWIGNYYVNENGKFDESSKENNTNSSGGSTNSGSNSSTQAHTHTWVPNYHKVNHPTTETYLISAEVPSQWVSTGIVQHLVCTTCGYDTTSGEEMSRHKYENFHDGNTTYGEETGYWTDPIPAQYGTRQVDNWVDEPDGTYTCSICGATK